MERSERAALFLCQSGSTEGLGYPRALYLLRSVVLWSSLNPNLWLFLLSYSKGGAL